MIGKEKTTTAKKFHAKQHDDNKILAEFAKLWTIVFARF